MLRWRKAIATSVMASALLAPRLDLLLKLEVRCQESGKGDFHPRFVYSRSWKFLAKVFFIKLSGKPDAYPTRGVVTHQLAMERTRGTRGIRGTRGTRGTLEESSFQPTTDDHPPQESFFLVGWDALPVRRYFCQKSIKFPRFA